MSVWIEVAFVHSQERAIFPQVHVNERPNPKARIWFANHANRRGSWKEIGKLLSPMSAWLMLETLVPLAIRR